LKQRIGRHAIAHEMFGSLYMSSAGVVRKKSSELFENLRKKEREK